ncbi:CBO0543 family protein [Dendrosporobacter sp. 1207_IL3150]|uniref:CBO0543 family protein n=1 Tax=Dendrosporobacter sp. 1207_IL3150 TaxID=3084054 RepID=UPI002FD9E7EB
MIILSVRGWILIDVLERLHNSRLVTWELKTFLWQQNFLTAKWWFIAIIIAISYAIWWKFTDKKRIIELLLFGSFIAVCRVIFDDWGINSGRWTYVIDIVPLGVSLFLNDLTIVPLSYMLAYQYSPSWSRFLVTTVILQSAISFAFLPLLSRLGILIIHNWHVGYTFIFMMVVSITMRTIILLGLNLQRNSRLQYSESISYELIPQPAMKPVQEDVKNEVVKNNNKN